MSILICAEDWCTILESVVTSNQPSKQNTSVQPRLTIKDNKSTDNGPPATQPKQQKDISEGSNPSSNSSESRWYGQQWGGDWKTESKHAHGSHDESVVGCSCCSVTVIPPGSYADKPRRVLCNARCIRGFRYSEQPCCTHNTASLSADSNPTARHAIYFRHQQHSNHLC